MQAEVFFCFVVRTSPVKTPRKPGSQEPLWHVSPRTLCNSHRHRWLIGIALLVNQHPLVGILWPPPPLGRNHLRAHCRPIVFANINTHKHKHKHPAASIHNTRITTHIKSILAFQLHFHVHCCQGRIELDEFADAFGHPWGNPRSSQRWRFSMGVRGVMCVNVCAQVVSSASLAFAAFGRPFVLVSLRRSFGWFRRGGRCPHVSPDWHWGFCTSPWQVIIEGLFAFTYAAFNVMSRGNSALSALLLIPAGVSGLV